MTDDPRATEPNIPMETGMFANLIGFIKDEDGATAIEYGLIAALVSVAAIGALTAMGDSLSTMFETVSSAMSGAMTP
jgi:pilus assembly protein Flp/PilA